MPCDECRLLLAKYIAESRRFEYAATDYRNAVESGIPADVEATKLTLDKALADARDARHAYVSHASGAHDG